MTSQARPVRAVRRVDAFPVAGVPISEPLLVTQAAVSWPVMSLLDENHFIDRFGDVGLVALTDDGREWEVTVRDYLSYCSSPQDEEVWYAKDWVVTDLLDELVGEHLPAAFVSWFNRLPRERRPRWEWLFLGPPRSASRLHVDTMCSTAWNLLLTGVKRWFLLSPGASLDEGLLEPEVAEVLDQERYAVDADQSAGDCLIVPSGWAHRVENLTPTIALTGNFVNRSNVTAVRAHHRAAGRDNWVRLLDRLSGGR